MTAAGRPAVAIRERATSFEIFISNSSFVSGRSPARCAPTQGMGMFGFEAASGSTSTPTSTQSAQILMCRSRARMSTPQATRGLWEMPMRREDSSHRYKWMKSAQGSSPQNAHYNALPRVRGGYPILNVAQQRGRPEFQRHGRSRGSLHLSTGFPRCAGFGRSGGRQ